MKQIRVIHTFYNSGLPVVEGGKLYPADHADALRQVTRGNAEVIEVPDALVDAPPASALVDAPPASALVEPAAEPVPAAPVAPARGRKG